MKSLILISSLLLIFASEVWAEQNELEESLSYIKEYRQCDHCNFTGANFKDFDFNGAFIDYSVFDNTIMEGAIMLKCHIDGGSFNNAIMVGANLEEAYIDHGSFRNAKLRNARLVKADLSKIHFDGADLRGANLSFSILKYAFFTGADLTDSKFIGANLEGTYLYDALSLTGADFSKADLSRAALWPTRRRSVASMTNEEKVDKGVYCEDLIKRGAIISKLTKCLK
ncbi:MAG: pentapeptide repeat-containing protein [Nitrospirae bacterium]|nr:pentapeptide repeat-containing protein [Nitrospirota bacterium]